jgi:hypothetical protein
MVDIYKYQKQDGEAFAREEQEFMERIQFERFNTEWGESCKKPTFVRLPTEQMTP